MIDGILWVLKTGARWRDLPAEYPSPSTCWRRLKRWDEDGTWLRIWRAFIAELDARGRLQWETAFIDGTFAPAKKGAPTSVLPSAGKAQSAWYWSSVRVIPLGITITAASPDGSHARRRDARDARDAASAQPKHLIGDRAYDSDPLRERLAKRGIVLTSPYRG